MLRERTRAAHEALDARVGAFADADAYGRYVAGLTAFRVPVEKALADAMAGASPSAVPFSPTTIGPLLKSDLSDLGLAEPAMPEPPALDASTDGLLGALYVMEGSALGARILFKRAQELGFGDSFGARHLARQSGTLDNWRALVAELDRRHDLDLDKAVAASLMTFEAAIDAFESADNGRI